MSAKMEMKNHLDFVVAAANLRASMFGIKGRTDEEYFRETLKNVIVPDSHLMMV
jgi:ubiquitin-activating enzyme E1